MTVPQTTLDALTTAAAAAADKLGTHIVAFDVAERLGLTNAFLIASGASERQVNAIVDGVEEALLKEQEKAESHSLPRGAYAPFDVDAT